MPGSVCAVPTLAAIALLAASLANAQVPDPTSPTPRPASLVGGVASPNDLNALAPAAAALTSIFSLTHLSQEQALAYLRAEDLKAPALNGHYLFVYQGVPDLRLLADGQAMLRVPTDAFAHTDSSAVVHFEARLANGNPLPGWLRFDGLRGVFSGTPPPGAEETLEIEVIADAWGQELKRGSMDHGTSTADTSGIEPLVHSRTECVSRNRSNLTPFHS